MAMTIMFDLPFDISAKAVLSSFTHIDLRNFQLVCKSANTIIQAAAIALQEDIDLNGKRIQEIPGSAPAFIRQRFRMDTFAAQPSWLNLVRHIQEGVSKAKGDPNDTRALIKYCFDKQIPDDQLYRLIGICVLFGNTEKCPYENPAALGNLLNKVVTQKNSFELIQGILGHPGAHHIRPLDLEWNLSRLGQSCGKEVLASVRFLKLLFAQSKAAQISTEELQRSVYEGVRRGNAEFVRVLFTHPNLQEFPTTGELRPGHIFLFPSPINRAVALEPPFTTILGALRPERREAKDLESAVAIAKQNNDPETEQVLFSHPNAEPLKNPCTIL